MPVDALFVERVDLRCLGGPAGGNDVVGNTFDGLPLAPREKERGSLARKGPCDSAADGASGSIDRRNLVLEHHSSGFLVLCLRLSEMQTPWMRENGRGGE